MRSIKAYLHSDDSWWAVRCGEKGPTTVCSVEVHGMSKLFAVHAEADSKAELITRTEFALAELKSGGASATSEAPKTGKSAKTEKTADAGPKLSVDAVKQGLTKLKDAIGGADDKDKKGIKAVKKILKDHGVSQTPDLKEDQYASVMAAVAKAMPADSEGEEGDGEEF